MGWTNKPTNFIKVVEGDLADKRTQIATEALRAVISGSPVDEGTYRSNHRVSVDSDDYGFDLNARDPGGQQTLSKGVAVIESAKGPYHAVTVQNNIVYGERLEDGHSQQAPNGVYRPAWTHIRAKHSK